MADNDELADCLGRIAEGDHDAFRRLYSATAPRLFAITLRLMGRRDQAEDVLQDAFVKVWRHANRFDRRRGTPMAWLVTTTRRCALDQLAKRQDHSRQAPIEDQPDGLVLDHGDGGIGEESAAVRRCLDRLSDRSRRLLLRAFFYGITHEQLSRSYDLPLGTVKSILRRALVALRKCLSS